MTRLALIFITLLPLQAQQFPPSAYSALRWRMIGPFRGGRTVAATGIPWDPATYYIGVNNGGVWKTSDTGRTWQPIFDSQPTGSIGALALAPSDPNVIYVGSGEGLQRPDLSVGDGIYKSTDAGRTWNQLGLRDGQQISTLIVDPHDPNRVFADGLGRIGIAIAPSNPRRMYALVDSKTPALFRSDDAGSTWTRVNTEERITGRGFDFANVRVDPNNPDKIYVANTSTYRSDNAGQTFTAIKGSPGGDDYHTIWINPSHPEIILLACDQGATITVNAGETWSTWYNQPTAQFYHVITDNRFPYWVYGAQQESGSAGVASRGDWGEITARDWHTIGVEEYGYVAPDPLDSNIIYGGRATRMNQITGEVQEIGPEVLRGEKYRWLRTMPMLFSPVDPHTLYLGSNVLFKTINGGHSWDVISPDLTREKYDIPATVGVFTDDARKEAKRRGAIYSIAPSHKDVNVIWAGTDDGLIHVTRDAGKTWSNITPPDLTPWSKVAQLDASHFDDLTVYAAINRFRLDDLKPHIYRTHDAGKTWKEIVSGLPDGPVNTVREDPIRKGLLYAGTELAVFVSFDDGDHWQPLRLNMPATSIRDLVIHDNDLVVGTHGRSFWILDDIAPLRQMTDAIANADAHLFRPSPAWRVRRSVNTDTPLPPEEPAGENPPDGAIIYYNLKSASAVTIEIFDAAKKLVRKYSSDDQPEPVPTDIVVQPQWVRPTPIPSAEAGIHRFVWDLHYPPPDSFEHEYPISAVWHDTPHYPQGPVVLPGQYSVKLTVNGTSYTQPLTVKMDPRVKTPLAGLQEQFRLAAKITNMMHQSFQQQNDDLKKLNGQLGQVLGVIEGADATPTTQAEATVAALERKLTQLTKPK